MVLSVSRAGADTLRAMRSRFWSLALAGLALGSLAMVGGSAIGGDAGSLASGYGLLIAMAALYAVAGLAIRERVWRRLSATTERPATDRLAGRRVF